MSIALGVALFVLGLGHPSQAPRANTADLRVMTYNIKHGQTNAACTQPAATPGQPPAPDCNLDPQASIAVILAVSAGLACTVAFAAFVSNDVLAVFEVKQCPQLCIAATKDIASTATIASIRSAVSRHFIAMEMH